MHSTAINMVTIKTGVTCLVRACDTHTVVTEQVIAHSNMLLKLETEHWLH